MTDADTTPLDWNAIDPLIFNERKILAMRTIREATGCGIREALKLLDDRYHTLRERHPERFPQVHPDLIAAHAQLLALLPNTRRRITAPSDMTVDRIWESASEAGALVESVMLPNPWRSTPAGQGRKDWEDYGTLELFDVVFRKHPPVPGPVWVIGCGLFLYSVQGEQLREFVAARQCDLHDDVLFIWQQSPRISLIHHEGAFVHIVVPSRSDAVVTS